MNGAEKRTGYCADCHCGPFRITKSGAIWTHRHIWDPYMYCSGSGKKPAGRTQVVA